MCVFEDTMNQTSSDGLSFLRKKAVNQCTQSKHGGLRLMIVFIGKWPVDFVFGWISQCFVYIMSENDEKRLRIACFD